jgi:hypothetical protein
VSERFRDVERTVDERVLLGEIVRILREPHCAELQADGAPCPSAHTACDQCDRAAELVEVLAHKLWGPDVPF